MVVRYTPEICTALLRSQILTNPVTMIYVTSADGCVPTIHAYFLQCFLPTQHNDTRALRTLSSPQTVLWPRHDLTPVQVRGDVIPHELLFQIPDDWLLNSKQYKSPYDGFPNKTFAEIAANASYTYPNETLAPHIRGVCIEDKECMTCIARTESQTALLNIVEGLIRNPEEPSPTDQRYIQLATVIQECVYQRLAARAETPTLSISPRIPSRTPTPRQEDTGRSAGFRPLNL